MTKRPTKVDDPQRQVGRLLDRYLDHVRAHDPVLATQMGFTERDGDLPGLAPTELAMRSRDLAVLSAEVDTTLAQLPIEESAELRQDLELLKEELAHKRFLTDVRPRFVLDPLAALETVASGVHELLRWHSCDAGERRRRLEAAAQRARGVPRLLEQAGSLLDSAPGPHLELAAQRLPGLLALFRDELPRRAEALGVDPSPARDAGEVAAEGLEAYDALLHELADEPEADWRLGAEQYAFTLRTGIGTELAPHQLEERARAWVARITAEMAELASSTWSRRFPGRPPPDDDHERIRLTLEAVADTAVTPERFVAEARAAVEEARAFALDREITDVPPATLLTVAEVPDHLRGIAVAFLAPPPPLHPGDGCTYYLSPVPDGWSAAQTRAFLREYHPAQLRSLAIHEAYPGHFVQLQHASQHPRLARRLFTRPAFAEGWAVYIEREVLAAGFGEEETSSVTADDYRITQRKGELRIATNALLDVGLHLGRLSDRDASDLLSRQGFQDRVESAGKLARAKVAGGQLASYFAGGEEFGDLRAEAERSASGAGFDRRRFHQQVLSQGTPPVRMVAEALRRDTPVHRPFATPVEGR